MSKLLNAVNVAPSGVDESKVNSMLGPPRKRAADGNLVTPQSKSPKTNQETDDTDVLCDLCEKVDFAALFTSKHSQTTLGPISHISDCLSCPICQHIAANTEKPYNANLYLRLVQVEVPYDEYISRSGIERSFRLEIRIYESNRPVKRITSLDICEGLRKPQYPNARMCRVPITEKFEPDLLFQWLKNSTKERNTDTKWSWLHLHPILYLISRGRFRVLDVNSGKVVVLDKPQPYLALSYVWGQTMRTRRNVVHYCPPRHNVVCNIDLEAEPATIRDAITLVRKLHERYLWIDSLCINQEDPSDKAEIVANMDAIYRGASLTIVAADGEDANAGLTRLHGNC